MIRKVSALAFAAIFSFSSANTSVAAPINFKNCSQLNKAYKFGIASSAKSVNSGAGPIRVPKVSASMYKQYKTLDVDRDGIVCEVLLQVAPILPQITFDALDVSRTSLAAQSNINHALSISTKAQESVLVIRSGPSITPEDISTPKKSLLESISLFSGLVVPSAMNVNWFSGQDAGWVDNAITESGGNPNATPTGGPFSAWISSVGVSACNMGNASIGSKGPYFNQCLKSAAPINVAAETASHEYFHTVQLAVSGFGHPIWFIEGSATFVGIHVGGHSIGQFVSARQFTLNRYATTGMDAELIAAIASSNREYVIGRLVQLESSNVNGSIRNSAYPLGMLVTEAMVAVGGFEKWTQFLQGISKVGFENSLKDSYGLGLKVLYEKTANYIISQLH